MMCWSSPVRASAAGRTSTPTRCTSPRSSSSTPKWASITDWADELAPHLDQATRMLGAVRYPYLQTDVDRVIQQVAIEMGRGKPFNKTPVSISAARASQLHEVYDPSASRASRALAGHL